MELLKDACTHELRELLTAWAAMQLIPEVTAHHYKRLREKIYKICDMLDLIEKQENFHV